MALGDFFKRKSPTNLSAYERSLIDHVAKDGWYCLSVVGEEVGDTFTYSVGFGNTLGSPECIIFGLPAKTSHSMLWEVFRQIRAGAVLSDGAKWSNLICGFDCVSKPVHPSQITKDHFNSALWFWRHTKVSETDLKAYQIFWPGSEDGLFPWDTGVAQIVRDYQPALYLPKRVLLT